VRQRIVPRHPPVRRLHIRRHRALEMSVADVAYLLLIIGFFGLMLAYVRGCEALGGKSGRPDEKRTP